MPEHDAHHASHHIHHLVLHLLLFVLSGRHKHFLLDQEQCDSTQWQDAEILTKPQRQSKRKSEQGIGPSQVFYPQKALQSKVNGRIQCRIQTDKDWQLQKQRQTSAEWIDAILSPEFHLSTSQLLLVVGILLFQQCQLRLQFLLPCGHNGLLARDREQTASHQDSQRNDCQKVGHSHGEKCVEQKMHPASHKTKHSIVQNLTGLQRRGVKQFATLWTNKKSILVNNGIILRLEDDRHRRHSYTDI